MSASKSSHLHNYEPMLNKSQLVIIIVYTYQHIRLNYKWFLFFVYQLLSSKNKYSYILFNYTFTFICNDLLLLIIQLFDTAWVKFQRFRCEKIWKIEKGNNLFVNLSDENGMCCKTNQSSSTIFFLLILTAAFSCHRTQHFYCWRVQGSFWPIFHELIATSEWINVDLVFRGILRILNE